MADDEQQENFESTRDCTDDPDAVIFECDPAATSSSPLPAAQPEPAEAHDTTTTIRRCTTRITIRSRLNQKLARGKLTCSSSHQRPAEPPGPSASDRGVAGKRSRTSKRSSAANSGHSSQSTCSSSKFVLADDGGGAADCACRPCQPCPASLSEVCSCEFDGEEGGAECTTGSSEGQFGDSEQESCVLDLTDALFEGDGYKSPYKCPASGECLHRGVADGDGDRGSTRSDEAFFNPVSKFAGVRCPRVRGPIVPRVRRADVLYLTHRENLRKITYVVDVKPSPLDIQISLRSQEMKRDFRRFQEINLQNKILLYRINQIMRVGGRIDTHNPGAGKNATKLVRRRIDLKKLDRENMKIHKRIESTKAFVPLTEDLHRYWKHKRHEMIQTAKYPPVLPGLFTQRREVDCLDQYRPRAWLDFAIRAASVDAVPMGRITVVLYSDLVPETSRNFMELILNHKRRQSARRSGCATGDYPHYVGSRVHKIFRNCCLEMGDMTCGNGTGGRAADGRDFPRENLAVRPDHPGMLAMVPNALGMVNSVFCITMMPIDLRAVHFDRVCFGRIVRGLGVLYRIEALSKGYSSLPSEEIYVRDCGLLPPRRFLTEQQRQRAAAATTATTATTTAAVPRLPQHCGRT